MGSQDMHISQRDLKAAANTLAQRILQAESTTAYFLEPYQHIVIDDAFQPELAKKARDNFPPMTDPSWTHTNDADIEIKSRSTWQSEFDIPDGVVDIVRIMNSATILRAIADKLNIPKLMPDPYYTGGGLNVSEAGGKLDVHVDGNYHDATGLNRRVNALLYLNENWQESWGGEFTLYDEEGEHLQKAIPPLFNRLLVFDTHDKSWHGVKAPVAFPSECPRCSIILYYYTVAPRPSGQVVVEKPHSALWKARGEKDKRGNKERDWT